MQSLFVNFLPDLKPFYLLSISNVKESIYMLSPVIGGTFS